ncbi:UdgX family uracil-DNA binding protein [Burkholderia gladioli]|uniref:UdgX family uracil-DNA binding protein n=1 Tax=Burkholderia gladioli TaxID=28095 RepID=UPI000CFE8A18|nr:UdgX family uracil-DNA binding protein [Burkholderia gladioli]MBJ9665628.1 UdgX family uracil-DNA binding protein [Burkholderia gladioli]PRE90213.1 uracil-DNA glycosylase [Burkholderia gladioli]
MRTIVIEDRFAAWRAASLAALAEDLPPASIHWRLADAIEMPQQQALIDYAPDSPGTAAISPRLADVQVSKEFAALLRDAASFRDPQRWAFLYKALWRWHHGDRSAASPADADGSRLYRMAKSVRRAQHDMIAYVRFRKQADAQAVPEYLAWYEPEHDVLEWAAEHFAQRMGRSSWLITTPRGAAFWDGSQLHLDARRALPGDHRHDTEDEAEALWIAYYRSTFNPARLNENALEQHMPVRFWKGLPEARLIPGMISEARSGARRLAQASGIGTLNGKAIAVEAEVAQPVREQASSLDACRRCDLWRNATQAVGSAGPRSARIMLIGEQPGDQEDLSGQPFVGPAGQLLDLAIERAGLLRDQVYLTNAVKHFKWEPRGKRRLHKTPMQREIEACHHWLEHELDTVRPAVIVALGATALTALLRRKTKLRDYVNAPFEIDGGWAIATYHPSFALRQQDDNSRDKVLDDMTRALVLAREMADADAPLDGPVRNDSA